MMREQEGKNIDNTLGRAETYIRANMGKRNLHE